MHTFSIIIPTLNEEKCLSRVLKHLSKFNDDIEIIISDGKSIDETIKTAEDNNAKVFCGNRGKGVQLNRGAAGSSGEVLILLHADTFLPDNAISLIKEYMFIEGADAVTFKMKFDSENYLMKIYSWFTKFDSIFTTFGDQVIVIRRSFFDELGGFPELPIFEDVELLRKIRKLKRIKKLPSYVITSARRFEKGGIIKTQILNFLYILQYLGGASPDKIYNKYFNDKPE
jgi:rSAM/selenodomain-associated transferase 2